MNSSSRTPTRHFPRLLSYEHKSSSALPGSVVLEQMLASSEKAIRGFASQRLRSFVGKRISKDIVDVCASFLAAEGTLSAPSLIVRCNINGSDVRTDVVVDKPISQWRLSECFLPFLSRVLPHFRGRADFLLLLSDRLHAAPEALPQLAKHFLSVPFLRCDWNNKRPDSRHGILIPDFYIQKASYRDVFREIMGLQAQYPFPLRTNKVMWRGSLSGPAYVSLENVHTFPRFKLLELSRLNPKIIDARLTNYDDDELGRYLLKRFGASAPFIPEPAFIPYKYLISIDGAASAWRRVPMCLISGSVLLLQHEWSQFFYPGLVPWIHYVPLRKDVSDLVEKYEWLEAHPAEAEGIASSGRAFALRLLSPEAIEKYFLDVIVSLPAN